MAMKSYSPKAGRELTAEEEQMLKDLEQRPVTYDEDCPELTDEQLAEFHAVHPELRADPTIFKPRKLQITLKLDADIVRAYQATGKGYQTRINNALRRDAENIGILIRSGNG